jgi:predicted nuclease of restriction endonuclease-like RecB superfamily
MNSRIKMSHSNSGKPPRWKGRVFEYNGLKLRSSYELFYAQYLDSQGIRWEYEPHFRLSDGRLFSPDFRLDDGTIVEIKGYWTLRGREKWDLFCRDFAGLPKRVMMKGDLINLGMEV